MARGWVKTYRDLLENKVIFGNPILLKTFMWCLLKATHEEYDQLVGRRIVHLLPGQFVTGRNKASEELDLKPSTAWDYLKILESNKTIKIKSNSKFSIVTLVNWSLYQSKDVNTDSDFDSRTDSDTTEIQHKQEHNNTKNLRREREEEDTLLPTMKAFFESVSKGSIASQELRKARQSAEG